MKGVERLSLEEARAWFQKLSPARRIATLSPDYVVADAVRDTELEPLLLGYREGDAFWMHGVHRGWVEKAGCWDFQSPYGYGGPVTNAVDQGFLDRAWNAYREWCRDNNVMVEFVRLHPLASGWQSYGGEIRDDRQTVVVPLAGDIRAGYEIRCRTAVRKAERAGLRVEIRPSVEIATRFAAYYRQGMQRIGADVFYLFNDDYFEALGALSDIALLVCMRDEEWLSAGLFFSGGNAMEYHLSATSAAGRKLSATNLLIDAAIQYAMQDGMERLYLGGGSDGREDNPLLFFKAGFSSGRAPFRFGFCIHQAEAYRRLKEASEKASQHSGRVLFYR